MELNQLSNEDMIEVNSIRKIDIEYSLNQYKEEMISMIQEYSCSVFGSEFKS